MCVKIYLIWCNFVAKSLGGSLFSGHTGTGLVINMSQVRLAVSMMLRSNLWQVVHAQVPMSPNQYNLVPANQLAVVL